MPFIDSSCIAQLLECFTRLKAAACQLNVRFTNFLNSRKHDDIGLAANKLYRQILLDGGLVALQTQYSQ
jgi:hypothetical protein